MFNIFLKRLPIVLGALAAGVYFGPATDKLFFNNAGQVGAFTSLGFASPETVVLLLGIFELVAMFSLALGIGGRVMSIAVIIEMLIAISYVGIKPNNVVVLLCAIGILLLGTGANSLWQPLEAQFNRFIPKMKS